jgi:hypothetical protein
MLHAKNQNPSCKFKLQVKSQKVGDRLGLVRVNTGRHLKTSKYTSTCNFFTLHSHSLTVQSGQAEGAGA